jgi:hypothetical protein
MMARPPSSGKLTRKNAGLLAAGLGCLALGAGATELFRWAQKGEVTPACRDGSAQMARLELLFGTGRKDGGAVGEVEWQGFVDAEITPRFPEGLTVLTGYGQWRSGKAIQKEGSRLLLIWYARAPDSEGKIEAIRRAYTARFGQDSVLRADGLSCVAF